MLTCYDLRLKTTGDAEEIAETAPAENALAEQVQSTEPLADKDAEVLATDQGVQAGDSGSQEVSAQTGSNSVSGSNNADNMGGFHGIYSAVNNGLGGDMNQMQMMMAMQNGMMPGGFNFPMMGAKIPLFLYRVPDQSRLLTIFFLGMAGMNMDPSMQGMYMNGGFPNMMGGGRFDGTGGGNGLNNWNGQQAWNGGGQDSFNYANASLGMNGEFGSFNVGFQPGYNQQGNFGYQTQNQFNNYRGFGRGRGRGRGYFNNGNGYGRGGYYNNGSNVNFHQGNEFGYNGTNNNFNYQQGQGFGYQQDQQEANTFGNDAGKEISKDAPGGNSGTAGGDDGGTESVTNEGEDMSVEAGAPLVRDDSSNSGVPIPVLDTRNVVGRPMQGQFGMFNNVTAGQQGINGIPKGPSPDVPLNAPSGPKAMRQGLRNTSALHLRARGLIRDDQPEKNNGHDTMVNVSGQNSPMTELSSHGRSRSNSVSGQRRDRDRHRALSKDRGRNHSDYHSRDQSPDQDYDNRSSQRHSDQNGHSHSDYKRTNDRNQAPVEEDHLVAEKKRHVSDEDLDYEHHSEWEDDFQQRGSDRDDRDDRDDKDDRNSVNGRGRSESRSTNGREREPSQDSLGPENEQPEEVVQGSVGAKSRRNRHRGGRRHRRNRQREDGQQAAKPSSGGNAARSRSRSPVDNLRRSNGHRSHRERDREHRDRSKDRDRDRDDHRRRSHRNEERERDREDKDHREHDRSRDKGRRDKDRHDRRDRDRERDKERGRDKSRDNGSAAKVSFEIKGASSKGQANGHGGKNTSNGVSSSGSSDPYAAERERRTRERMAAEAQKRAGISSLVGGNGTKRGRDDFEEGGGGGSSGGGRRNRRKGRRGDAVVTDDNGDRRRGESERDDHR